MNWIHSVSVYFCSISCATVCHFILYTNPNKCSRIHSLTDTLWCRYGLTDIISRYHRICCQIRVRKREKTFLIDDNAEKRCLGEVIVIEFPVSLLFRHLRDDYKKMCVYQPRLHRLPSQRPRHFCWNSFGEVDSTYQEMFPILSLPMDINGGDQLTKHDHFHDSGINCGVVWFGVCRHNELCGDCF